MDCSAISPSVGGAAAVQGSGARPQNHRTAIDAAASLLGMSSDDLRTALQGGQSLSAVASAKGVSQDDLVKAMAGAITQANPNVSATQATEIATRIATHVPTSVTAGGGTANPAGGVTGAKGHHHHHGGGGGLMSSVSQLLGESTTDVATALTGGQTLADVAKSQGVSQDDLVKTIAASFQKANPNISSDLATQLATQFATASPQAGSLLNVAA